MTLGDLIESERGTGAGFHQTCGRNASSREGDPFCRQCTLKVFLMTLRSWDSRLKHIVHVFQQVEGLVQTFTQILFRPFPSFYLLKLWNARVSADKDDSFIYGALLFFTNRSLLLVTSPVSISLLQSTL